MKSPLPAVGLLMIGALLAGTSQVRAQIISGSIDSSYYGYLDQYSLNAEHDFVGNEACVPTSTTNALTLLQNLNPTVFGTNLTGNTYQSWHAADNVLIADYGTTTGNGTYDYMIPSGLTTYLSDINGVNYNSDIALAGQFHNTGWNPPDEPQPLYISSDRPTAQFIATALQNLNGVIIGISYTESEGGGGHELLVNGISWNTTTNTGTITFIDPLHPTLDYISGDDADPATSYDQSVGPPLETMGTLTMKDDGTLVLDYEQYDVTGIDTNSPNPIDDFDEITADITSDLSIGAVPEPSQYGFLVFLGSLAFIARKKLGRFPRQR